MSEIRSHILRTNYLPVSHLLTKVGTPLMAALVIYGAIGRFTDDDVSHIATIGFAIAAAWFTKHVLCAKW